MAVRAFWAADAGGITYARRLIEAGVAASSCRRVQIMDVRRTKRTTQGRRAPNALIAVTSLALLVTACGGQGTPSAGEDGDTLTVFGAYATQIEEPWDGVIHAALNAEMEAGRIEYTFTDDIGYAGDMERVLRETAEQDAPDIIFGDAFGNEEAARAVAADYPDIAFVFGSGGGPAEPNFSVFDNWIHEPAYLAGMIAGGATESNVLGVVGGYPVPEVNRIVNAFIAGAQETNEEVDVKVTFLNSWFDPAAAKEAALAQVGAGADVLFAERFGVIEAADENDLLAIGNMSDQQELAPDNVVTSVTWNMAPTVKYVIDQVSAGAYTAQDLKDFSMVAKGGAALAEINTDVVGGLPDDIVAAVEEREAQIKAGTFRVDITESTPPGSTIPDA
jgi:basic membrane protein A and related proteins